LYLPTRPGTLSTGKLLGVVGGALGAWCRLMYPGGMRREEDIVTAHEITLSGPTKYARRAERQLLV